MGHLTPRVVWCAVALLTSSQAMQATAATSRADLALARDYVLAACVMQRYADTPLAAEADAWAGGLVEQGHLPAEAYPALAQLARSAPAPGKTQGGVAMRLQSCVDFVHGPAFAAQLQRALKR